jgi:hypothetical protein
MYPKIQHSYLLLLILFLSLTSCEQDEDIGPNTKSTANTVLTFPIFSQQTPYQQKTVDKEGNVYVFAPESGRYRLGTDQIFETTRNNTLVKLSPSMEFIASFEGVQPLVNRKITLGENDVIYMKSESLSNDRIIKINTDGTYVSTDPISVNAFDLEADASGNYYTLELGSSSALTLNKYAQNNSMEWSIEAGINVRLGIERLKYVSNSDLLLVLSTDKLVAYNGTNGETEWSYSIGELDCGNLFASGCTPGFIEVDQNGDIFLAYTTTGLRNSEIVQFIEVRKLNSDGNELFAKTIKTDKSEAEDFFVTGLTVYNGSFYMSVNSKLLRQNGFAAGEAYIGKYDAETGGELWRQYPSWNYVALDEFPASDFSFSLPPPVYIKDLIQDPSTGKLWCTIAIDINDNIGHPDGINGGKLRDGRISDITAISYFGGISHQQKYVATNTIYRNISSLNP